MIKRRLFMVVIVVLLVLMVAGVAEASLGSRLLYYGSRGSDVAELQRIMNWWGIWAGPVDGIFGWKTYNAVISFQRRNGLVVDGVVGPQTVGEIRRIQELDRLAAGKKEQQQNISRGNYAQWEIDLLARLVQAEAGGEPYTGKVAVAASVLNRVRSSRYPNTLSGVIYQVVDGYYQYSPVLDGRIKLPATWVDYKAVQDALNGWDPSYGALGFYNPAKTSNWWVRSQPVTTVIGNHVFFR